MGEGFVAPLNTLKFRVTRLPHTASLLAGRAHSVLHEARIHGQWAFHARGRKLPGRVGLGKNDWLWLGREGVVSQAEPVGRSHLCAVQRTYKSMAYEIRKGGVDDFLPDIESWRPRVRQTHLDTCEHRRSVRPGRSVAHLACLRWELAICQIFVAGLRAS